MKKNNQRLADLLQMIDNINPPVENIKVNLPQNTQKQKKSGNYWDLSNIHSDVFEFTMMDNEDSNTSNVKMYIIKTDNYNDIDYYSILTVAFNKTLQKTVSNYGVGTEETILSNFNINISEIKDGISDNVKNIMEEYDNIENDEKNDEEYAKEVAEYLSENLNIIKSACTNKKTFAKVMYELFMNMLSDDTDYDEDN